MTKKDYVKIAAVLNMGCIQGVSFGFDSTPEMERAYKVGSREQWLEIVNRISGVLSQDNPRFDRAKFLEACGL